MVVSGFYDGVSGFYVDGCDGGYDSGYGGIYGGVYGVLLVLFFIYSFFISIFVLVGFCFSVDEVSFHQVLFFTRFSSYSYICGLGDLIGMFCSWLFACLWFIAITGNVSGPIPSGFASVSVLVCVVPASSLT